MPADHDGRPVDGGAGPSHGIGGFALVGFLLLLVSASALASLPSAADGERPLAIVFPPWLGAAQAVSRSFEAGYSVMRTGRLDSIVVVAPMRRPVALPQGAWLSVTLKGLAGCLDGAAEAGELP